MLWFEESHTSLLLCNGCNCVLFGSQRCMACGFPFHRRCLLKHHLVCKSRESIKSIVKRKEVALIPDILGLRKTFTNPAVVYSYILDNMAAKSVTKNLTSLEDKKCHNCGHLASFQYTKPFCDTCIKCVDRNEYCPVCFKVYDPNNYQVEMMCCDFCLRWIHLQCDSTFKEKYRKNSESVEYQCPSCVLNAKRWKRIEKTLLSTRKLCGKDNIVLDGSEVSEKLEDICTYCGDKGADDPVFFLRPTKNTIPSKIAHTRCRNHPDKRCVQCKGEGASIKCPGCDDCFHLRCAEGLFRQDSLYPMCNDHFQARSLHRKTKSYSRRCDQGGKDKKPGKKRFRKINLLAGNTIYQPSCLIRIVLLEKKLCLLKFNGERFFLDEECVDKKHIRNKLNLDIEQDDLFGVKSSAYIKYRKRLMKNIKHEEMLASLLGIYAGSTNYFFGQ